MLINLTGGGRAVHPTGEPLEGIDLKMARADQYLEDIKGVVSVFHEPETVTLRSKFNRERTEEFLFVHHRRPLPALELGVLVGQFVHELRSTLDHLVWALDVLKVTWAGQSRGKAKPKSDGFPFCTSRKQFFARDRRTGGLSPSSGLHHVAGMRPDAQTFIERVQPYDGRDDMLILRYVQALDNLAKHRVIPVVALQTVGLGYSLPPGTRLDGTDRTRPLEDGAYFGTLHHSAPRDEVQMYLRLTPAVVIPAIQPGKTAAVADRPLHVWMDLFWMIQNINRFVLYPARRDFLGYTSGYSETWITLRDHWRALGIAGS